MNGKPSFFAELQRRNVIRAGVLYVGGVWAFGQGLSQFSPALGLPDWATRWFLIAAAIGFPFWIAFAWFYEFTPQGLKRESEVPADTSIVRSTGRKLDKWIIAVLAIAVVFLLTNTFLGHKAAAPEGAGASAIPDKSVAVLPLMNESSDKDQQYFSDGLSENLIIALSQFAGLKVIGRNSSFQFRDSKDDSRTIGAKLGVATLLEGSVQHAGDAVRISAELIRAADGATMWSQNYDRPYKDLFALQDEITQSVAGALKAKLLTNDGATVRTDHPPSGNLDAYNAYLQGNYYTARGSEEDLRKAIAEYETATRIDPRYALAWAAMAHACDWLGAGFLTGSDEGQRVLAQARKAADTALDLEPNLAAAHSVRGELLSIVDFDWDGAQAEHRRALQLDPGNDAAMENLGVWFALSGRTEEAIAMTRQSLVTDPMRATGYLLLARYLTAAGRLDEAERTIGKAIKLQPASDMFDAGLVDIKVRRGDPKAALEAAQKVPPGTWQDYALAMARQIGSDRVAADAALKRLINKNSKGMAFQIAEVQAVRGDPDQTFEWLDRALANHDPGLQFLLVNPFILRYRDDPRFAAFCKKVGMPTTTDAKAMP